MKINAMRNGGTWPSMVILTSLPIVCGISLGQWWRKGDLTLSVCAHPVLDLLKPYMIEICGISYSPDERDNAEARVTHRDDQVGTHD